MGFLKSVGTVFIYIGLFLAIITFIPGLPPEAEFSEYRVVTAGDVKQPFELKNHLRGAEVLFSGELKGPESFDSYAGELYTGLHGGYVAKIEENHVVPIAKFGKKCDGIWQEEKCGRPLGLKFNDKGDLFVVDTYNGIFKLDVRTGQYKLIINTSEPINGKIPMIPNSLDIAKNGDIYWTDSSTEFPLYDGVYTALTNPSGRLFKYNAATKKNEVLLDKLHFANGVKLNEDESFLVVAETWASRINKYNLKGPKAGQREILAEGLPGLPDNIHSDKQGGFLVSLITYVDAEHPMLAQSLMPHPNVRKMFARLMSLAEVPLKFMQQVYPNPTAERLMHAIGSFEGFLSLDTAKQSVVLRLDANGKVTDAIYADDGSVDQICSAYIHNDYLWLGSPFSERLLRIPLEKAFPNIAKNRQHTVYIREKRDAESVAKKSESAKVESTIEKQKTGKSGSQGGNPSPAPTTTTPKPAPTTTTPKPTTTAPKPKAVPTEKPITTTTEKPKTTPKATTEKPMSNKPSAAKPTSTREANKKSDSSKDTPKKSSSSSPPPPPPPPASTQKPAQVKKDTAKISSNEKVKSKTDTPKSKSEQPSKMKDTSANSKLKKSSEESVREAKPEKVKMTDKNHPKDTSKTE